MADLVLLIWRLDPDPLVGPELNELRSKSFNLFAHKNANSRWRRPGLENELLPLNILIISKHRSNNGKHYSCESLILITNRDTPLSPPPGESHTLMYNSLKRFSGKGFEQ